MTRPEIQWEAARSLRERRRDTSEPWWRVGLTLLWNFAVALLIFAAVMAPLVWGLSR